jgi:hypothetical protein
VLSSFRVFVMKKSFDIKCKKLAIKMLTYANCKSEVRLIL